MTALDLIPPLLLGLAGSGHCVGMCGPLVLAFPAHVGTGWAHAAWHAGRVTTYAAIGALMGAMGTAAVGIGDLAGLARAQASLSLPVAALLAWMGLARIGLLREPEWLATATPDRVPGFRRLVALARGGRSPAALLALGLLLGFLPCGLSYAAFAQALTSGGPARGALSTFAFGLGTLPALLALGTVAAPWLRRHRAASDLIAGIVLVGMAAVLAARALSA